MKGNVIQLNTLHLNSVRLNGIGKVQSVSLKGGSTEDPVFPPVEPPIEPEPTPTYTLSASVTNGMVSAKRNGSAVTLPFTANEGDTIVVEVTPNDGYAFEGWVDGNTDNPRTITMNADVALSAECSEVVQPPVGNYIQFEDKNVEAICVANWSSDGIGLTEEDAAAVTSIGTTFKGNTEITSFNELRYFTKVTTLDNYALQNCSNLVAIDLSNILVIGAYSLEGIAIKEMILTEGFVEIKLRGASKITPLEKVDFPSTTTSIGDTSFVYCSVLASVICRATTPPALVANAFGYGIGSVAQTPIAKGTGNIYVPDASLEAYKTAVNWSAYADRIHPLSEIEGSPYIQFEDAEVERVLMANGVSSDGIGITKEDAAAVTTIGTWFKGNTAMTSFNELQYFTGLTSWTNYAMMGCNKMTSITLPTHLTSIPVGLFANCVKLQAIDIPVGVNLINREAFYGCSGLITMRVFPTNPPTLTFNAMQLANNVTFYVPDASLEAYKAANIWSTYADRIKPLSELNA